MPTTSHPCRQLSIPVHKLRALNLAFHPSALQIWSQVFRGGWWKTEARDKDPPGISFLLPMKGKTTRVRGGAGQQAPGYINTVPGEEGVAVQASPHTEPGPQQLYLLPEVTATSAPSRTRRKSPMGTCTATSPKEPHTVSLSRWHREPWKGLSFPKGQAQPCSTLPTTATSRLVERGRRGLPGQRPSQSEASDQVLSALPRRRGVGGLLTTEGENPFSGEAKKGLPLQAL